MFNKKKESIKLIIPIFINRILKYFDGQSDLNSALLNGFYMSICVTINCVLHHPYFLNSYKLGFKMRVACSGLIYKKVSRLKLCGLDIQSNGQIINMLSNDLSRFEYVLMFMPFLFIGPFQAVVTIFLLVKQVDVSILSGLIVMAIFIPLQAFFGKLYDRVRY
jgi:ATP-binding cassette subfamily C (CFTR/MRP) protein 4